MLFLFHLFFIIWITVLLSWWNTWKQSIFHHFFLLIYNRFWKFFFNERLLSTCRLCGWLKWIRWLWWSWLGYNRSWVDSLCTPNWFDVIQFQSLDILFSILLAKCSVSINTLFYYIITVFSSFGLVYSWIDRLLLLIGFIIEHTYWNRISNIRNSHTFFSLISHFAVGSFLLNIIV